MASSVQSRNQIDQRMTTATATKPALNLNEMADAWREARRIYPVYAAMIRQFDLGVRPSAELESPINRSEPEVLTRIARWFDEVDGKCQVWQLRQILQTSAWVSDDQLRSMVRRHLKKPNRDEKVRDKVDYLMVQYYAHRSPEDALNHDITFEHVAELVEELTGPAGSEPELAGELQKILDDLGSCTSLKHLLEKKLIERSREIKGNSGEKYFEPGSLIAFARFNFMMRLGFFRLIHADLHAIRFALHVLEERGQSECDCSPAGLSKCEPIAQLRQICQDWKKPFRAAYSAAVNFKQIVDVRTAVEAAAAAPAPAPRKEAAPVPKPTAAAAPKAPEPNRVQVKASPKLLTTEECIEQIAERLLRTTIKNAQVTNLMFGEVKILLASWEVQAFTHGGDESADTMQRAVAARVALSLAMEEKRAGRAKDISEAIGWAHAEAAQIQERIAEAKEKKNIDAAVNLAATSKRLVAMAAEAEKQG
jgi:hypothetical protein